MSEFNRGRPRVHRGTERCGRLCLFAHEEGSENCRVLDILKELDRDFPGLTRHDPQYKGDMDTGDAIWYKLTYRLRDNTEHYNAFHWRCRLVPYIQRRVNALLRLTGLA